MATIIDQGVVVRLWDFSETSQTVSLLLREHGVLRGLAKGSRREKGNFSGGLDLLTRGEIVAIVKQGAELAILTEWDLREVYWGPRRSLRANRAGLYMVDLVHHALTPNDPHPAVFDALTAALEGLGSGPAVGWTLLKFQWALLVETGYQPRLGATMEEGAAAPRAYGFDPLRGEVVDDPGPERSGGADAKVWRVRADTVEVLRLLERSGGGDDAGAAASADGVERSARLLGAYIELTTGHRIPSGPVLFDSR